MGRRIIPCLVTDEYVRGAGVVVGAAGSHKDVALRLEFCSMWEGTTRSIVWHDALGGNPTVTILTADLLETGETEVYVVPIPAEPKAYAGEMSMTIKGVVVDGDKEASATLTTTAFFTVMESSWDAEAVEGGDVNPTQAEQLQSQIDTLLGDMQEQAQRAETAVTEAQGHAETAKAEADRSKAGADFVAEKAAGIYEALTYAQLAAGVAQTHATEAERSAEAAQGSADAAAASAALAAERASAAESAEQAAQDAMDAKTVAETMASEAQSAAKEAQNAVAEAAAEKAAAEGFARQASEQAAAAANQVVSAGSAAIVAQSNANAAANFAGEASGYAQAAQGAASAASAAASMAAGEASEQVSKHSASESAHEDIRAEIAEIKKQIENTVAADISTAVRMVAEFNGSNTALSFAAHNGSMILCAAEANEATFADRNSVTKYLIPIPETATKVTVETSDPQVTLAQFVGVNGSGGSYTKVFSSTREAVYSYEFEKSSAQWMAIDLIYEDTGAVSVPWDYDAAATTTVTFTLAAEQGVTSWNDLTDKPFGEEAKAVLPEDTFDLFSDLGGIYAGPLPTFDLEVGKTYLVLWDGEEFPCVATSAVFNGAETLGIGNLAIAGLGENTGEPFLIGVLADGSDAAAYTTDAGESHTVGVWGEVVKPLDAKYLPMDAIRDVVNEVISEALEGEY